MITMEPLVYEKIWTWTEECPKEVSAYGTVQKIREKLHIDQLFLLEQECGGAYTKPKETELAMLMSKLEQDGRGGDMRFWWHSHANMRVFFSSTDRETISELAGPPFFISLVTNQKGDYEMRCDFLTQGGFHQIRTGLEYRIANENTDEQLKNELNEKVDLQSVTRTVHFGKRRFLERYNIRKQFDGMSYLETIKFLKRGPDGNRLGRNELMIREKIIDDIAEDPDNPTKQEVKRATRAVKQGVTHG